MKKQYQEKVVHFFSQYSDKRRKWQKMLNQWKEQKTKKMLQMKSNGKGTGLMTVRC